MFDYDYCVWYSDSFTVTAPSTPGTYTYTVKVYGDPTGQPDASMCDYADDSASCTVEVVECLSDADCPPKDLKLGKCDTTGAITGTAYTCYWPACNSNDDCVEGACCVDDPSGPGPKTGECVSKGVYSGNPTYLCDPPKWKRIEKKELSVFEIALKLIYSFFPYSSGINIFELVSKIHIKLRFNASTIGGGVK